MSVSSHDIVIIGAGVIGICSAYYLAKAGHRVIVIERGDGVSQETSFANGGQLSYAHSMPWCSPEILRKLPIWLLDPNSPLKFHWSWNGYDWKWFASFLLNAASNKKTLASSKHILELAAISCDELIKIKNETHINFNHQNNGSLHLFYDNHSLKKALHHAELQQEWLEEKGFITTNENDNSKSQFYQHFSPQSALAKEPALEHIADRITGAIYYPFDEVGDCWKFTLQLAEYCRNMLGVEFILNTEITELEQKSGYITAAKGQQRTFHHDRPAGNNIEIRDFAINASKFVITGGSISHILLRKLGFASNIMPVKGYSMSVPLTRESLAPKISITDHDNKLVFSKLGDTLRVAGMAELSGYNNAINNDLVNMLTMKSFDIFPHSAKYIHTANWQSGWSCLRCCTSDGKPLIGRANRLLKSGIIKKSISKIFHDGAICKNLYVNTGHNNLGWTLACGSGLKLAEEMHI